MGDKMGASGQSEASERPARTRVLIVDDYPDIARTASVLFQLLGFEVEIAYDGEAAVEAAHAFAPDVAILDIGLPGLNGFELAGTLRKKRGPALLLIAVSGYGQEDYRARSKAAGFDYHFAKPADLVAIASIISNRSASDRQV
jgi:CheY-like chemotaxis protein